MNKLYSVWLTFLFGSLLNQTLAQHIPDAQFASAIRTVCSACIDNNNDLTSTATFLSTLNVNSKGINDLTGIGGFTSLSILQCESNNLTSLPDLPASLTQLFCQDNRLASLPTFSNNIVILSLKGNDLSSLPNPLPSNLNRLNINQNHISSLPALPASLESLSAYSNTLTSLPSPLPTSLKVLGVNTNQLTSLPELPSVLEFLDCGGNSSLMCLPILPNSLTSLTTVATNITCIPNKPAGLMTSLPICNGSNGCATLPLELIAFQIISHKENVEINWTTASESNLLDFIIERSNDGLKFYPLSIEAPKANDKAEKAMYHFIDDNPLTGIDYYRLKIEEKDGTYSYSKTLSAQWGNKINMVVYPNPFMNILSIDLPDANAQTAQCEIFDMTGRKHFSQTISASANFDTENLPSGMYILKVKQEGLVMEKKIFKQ